MTKFSVKNSLKNSFWLISEKLVRFFIGFFITTLIIKHLGPNNFGYFSYSLTIASIFGLLSKFGLDTILIKELSEEDSKESELLSNSLFIRISFSIATILIVIPIIYYLGESDIILGLVSVFMLTNIFQSHELFEAFLQSKLKNKLSSIIALCALLVASLLRILFLHLDLGVFYFSLAILFETSLLFLGLFFLLKNKLVFLKSIDLSTCKDLIIKSYPLLISSIFAFVYLKIDTIMLRFLTNFENVGIYSSAVKLSEILYLFPILISGSFLPILVRNKKDSVKLKRTFSRLFLITISFSIFSILFFNILSAPIVNLIYGSKYIEASNIINLHVWSLLAISINSASSKLIIIENNQKLFIKISLAGALSNIILNFFLIDLYGILGAAYSTLISYFFVSTYTYLAYRRLLKIKTNV
jgi:O-antigen/teichoic acid export membrane protein